MNVCFFMPGFITLSKNILTMKQSENGQQETRRSKRSVMNNQEIAVLKEKVLLAEGGK